MNVLHFDPDYGEVEKQAVLFEIGITRIDASLIPWNPREAVSGCAPGLEGIGPGPYLLGAHHPTGVPRGSRLV